MENWKPVVGYEGFYEVSDQGRVRSVDHVVKSAIRFNTQVVRKGRLLKLKKNRTGYYVVTLSSYNKVKTVPVHRMVAKAFIPEIEGKPVVNHRNCIKTDNRVENLEWCTDRENKDHALANHRYANPRKKAVRCKQNGMVFESSYTAAEWVNETRYGNAKQMKNIASKIRASCLGMQKVAHGYTWEQI